MTLIHSPARTTFHPDRFTDDETGIEYSVFADVDAEDPRTNMPSEHAALWVFREPPTSRSVASKKPEGNLAIDAFAHYWARFDADKALRLTLRFLALYHPNSELRVSVSNIRGDSQGDWLNVVCAVTPGYGTPWGLMNEFRMWAFGDVWTVIPDGGSGISGIYAESQEAAVEHFIASYSDSAFVHTVEIAVTASNADQALGKVEQFVAALHETDALPAGIHVRSFAAALAQTTDQEARS